MTTTTFEVLLEEGAWTGRGLPDQEADVALQRLRRRRGGLPDDVRLLFALGYGGGTLDLRAGGSISTVTVRAFCSDALPRPRLLTLQPGKREVYVDLSAGTLHDHLGRRVASSFGALLDADLHGLGPDAWPRHTAR